MLARLEVRCNDCGRPCDTADNYCRRCGHSLTLTPVPAVYESSALPARVFRAIAPFVRPAAPIVRGAALVAAGAGMAVLGQRVSAGSRRKPKPTLDLVAWTETIVTRQWTAKPGER